MRLLAIVCLLLAPACLKALAPDVGPQVQGACIGDGCIDAAPCSDLDSDPQMPVTYSADLYNADLEKGVFFRGRCNTCHTDKDEKGTKQSGLDISSYDKLRAGGTTSRADIVIDFMPCASILVDKIEDAPKFGRRMPFDGPPYLEPADIQLVRDWIAAGAPEN
jgi:hypothetical protein